MLEVAFAFWSLVDPKPPWTALLAAAQHWMGDYRRTPQKRAFPSAPTTKKT